MRPLAIAVALSLLGVATAAAGPRRLTPANDTPAKRQKLFRKARHKLIESNALLQGVIDGTSPRPARDALHSAKLRVDALFASQDARGGFDTIESWRDHFTDAEAKLVESPALDALVRHEILSAKTKARPPRTRRLSKGAVTFPSVGQIVYSAQHDLHRPERPAFDASPGGDRRTNMIRSRRLHEITPLLGTKGRTAIESLGEQDLWLDVGTGFGNAPLDYHRNGGKARVVGIDLEVSENLQRTAAERTGGRVQLRQGDVRSLRLRRKAKLVTDVFGAMSYTDRPDQVLRAYGRALEPGGQVIMMMAGSELNTVLDHDGGGKETLVDFIGRARGFELERVVELNIGTLVVARRTADRVVVPSVEMLKAADRGPPHRTFRVTRGADPSSTSAGRDAYKRALYRTHDRNW